MALALGISTASALDGAPFARDPKPADRSLVSPIAAADRARSRSQYPEPSMVSVQNCNDSGPGSLRDAYANAVSGEEIYLTQLGCSTITLTTGALADPAAATDVFVFGPGIDQLTIDGNHADRVFVHNGNGQLLIQNLSVASGSYHGAHGGGCVYSHGSVYVNHAAVTDCTVSSTGTTRANGGAVYAVAAARMFHATVSGSTAHAASANSAGGGVWGRDVSIRVSTISGNTVSGDGSHFARGGGVYALGEVAIEYSTIAGNQAETGAGAFFVGAAAYPMRIITSTISGNHSSGAAGGVYSKYRPLQVTNSTIAQNTASFPIGAGLYLASATDLQSTIVANNSAQEGLYPSDIGGTSTTTLTGANNLIVASTLPVPSDTIVAAPLLGPLADNGGYTWTHALLAGSPAIDRGSAAIGMTLDQRVQDLQTGVGYERVVGASADIGAFEFGSPDRIFANGFQLQE